MAKGKKHKPEQIVSLLRQIEVAVANGKTTPNCLRKGGITERTYYRWRKEFAGFLAPKTSILSSRSGSILHSVPGFATCGPSAAFAHSRQR